MFISIYLNISVYRNPYFHFYKAFKNDFCYKYNLAQCENSEKRQIKRIKYM